MLSASLSLFAKVVAREFGRGSRDRVGGWVDGEERDYAMRASAVRVGCVPVSTHQAGSSLRFLGSETGESSSSFPAVG